MHRRSGCANRCGDLRLYRILPSGRDPGGSQVGSIHRSEPNFDHNDVVQHGPNPRARAEFWATADDGIDRDWNAQTKAAPDRYALGQGPHDDMVMLQVVKRRVPAMVAIDNRARLQPISKRQFWQQPKLTCSLDM
jgi:hypothetical protein